MSKFFLTRSHELAYNRKHGIQTVVVEHRGNDGGIDSGDLGALAMGAGIGATIGRRRARKRAALEEQQGYAAAQAQCEADHDYIKAHYLDYLQAHYTADEWWGLNGDQLADLRYRLDQVAMTAHFNTPRATP